MPIYDISSGRCGLVGPPGYSRIIPCKVCTECCSNPDMGLECARDTYKRKVVDPVWTMRWEIFETICYRRYVGRVLALGKETQRVLILDGRVNSYAVVLDERRNYQKLRLPGNFARLPKRVKSQKVTVENIDRVDAPDSMVAEFLAEEQRRAEAGEPRVIDRLATSEWRA